MRCSRPPPKSQADSQIPRLASLSGTQASVWLTNIQVTRVHVRVEDTILIGFLLRELRSGSLELSQTPPLGEKGCGKAEGYSQAQKGWYVQWGEGKEKLGSGSCPFLGWAREKLPAGVGGWRASVQQAWPCGDRGVGCRVRGAGAGAHPPAATGQRAEQSPRCPPSCAGLGLGLGSWFLSHPIHRTTKL